MPRRCTVCSLPERGEVDKAIVGGASNRSLASLYDVSEAAIRRHAANHLSETLAKAGEAREVARGEELLADIRSLQERTLAILEAAEKMRRHGTALSAIREARHNLELLAKLVGQLNDAPQINVIVSAEWVKIRGAVVGALSPYPEARAAVSATLLEIEAGTAAS